MRRKDTWRRRAEEQGNRKKKHRGKAVDKILQESQEKNPTDVLGSWTGVPWNPEEAPVQDADDL